MSMPMRHGGDSRPTITMKHARPRASTPLKVQMLGFSSNLEQFAVCAVDSSLELPQGLPLGAVAPPDGKPEASH